MDVTHEDSREFFDIKRSIRLEKAARAAVRKDVLGWGKLIFPEKFFLPYCYEMHGDFVAIRGDEFSSRKAPRGHAKTATKCFLIPIYQGIYEPETFQHYLNIQATQQKALAINTSIKAEFESNVDLRELVGDKVGGDKWTDSQFVTTDGVVYSCIGAGQSIRGTQYRQRRPDYIIADDLYDEEDINNPDATLKKNKWFWGSVYSARAIAKRCSIHVQGTAINPYDLMTEMEKMPSVNSRTFKAVKDWTSKTVLWPEFRTFDQLMLDRERMGSDIFAREMQNEPRDEATSIIRRAWLYRVDGTSWEYDPLELNERLRHPETKTAIIAVRVGNDPSIGKKNENDATGTALVLVTQSTDGNGNEYWIEDIWGERLSLEKRISQLMDIARSRPEERPLTEVRIEAIAGFNDYADEVIRRTNLPVHRVEWVPDKITNLENRQHFFENGKVHLNKNIEQSKKDQLVEQLVNNYPLHDDMRDGVLLTMDNEIRDWGWVGGT